MIKFPCDNCGQKISVPEKHAGKAGTCPKCKNRVTVPKTDTQIELQPVFQQEEVAQYKHEAEYHSSPKILEDDIETGQRKYPWLIDIWLYPVSASGLTSLAIIIAFTAILNLIPLGPAGFLLSLLIGIYFAWYLTECIRDSAAGATRAPNVIGSGSDDLRSMFERWGYIFVCYFICIMPMIFYTAFDKQNDVIYWSLRIYGAVLFPMLFLSIIILDGASAFNPVTLIIAMIKTFPSYVLVVAVFFGFIMMMSLLPSVENKFAKSLSGAIFLYMIFIGAHLLGRFYWFNRFKLDWG
ncbi:MAG: hypothetical protein FVQ79_04900 [Planctomycetes bacterium]|nr:hypothetical protein [Planctomycetota bacterium]